MQMQKQKVEWWSVAVAVAVAVIQLCCACVFLIESRRTGRLPICMESLRDPWHDGGDAIRANSEGG